MVRLIAPHVPIIIFCPTYTKKTTTTVKATETAHGTDIKDTNHVAKT